MRRWRRLDWVTVDQFFPVPQRGSSKRRSPPRPDLHFITNDVLLWRKAPQPQEKKKNRNAPLTRNVRKFSKAVAHRPASTKSFPYFCKPTLTSPSGLALTMSCRRGTAAALPATSCSSIHLIGQRFPRWFRTKNIYICHENREGARCTVNRIATIAMDKKVRCIGQHFSQAWLKNKVKKKTRHYGTPQG